MSRQSYVLLSIYTAGLIAGALADWQEEYTEILNDESDKDFLNAIKKLKHDFQAYNFDDDRAIPWRELKATVDDVDHMRVSYHGAAASDLVGVEETTVNLMNEYRKTTSKMFRWAITGRETFYFLSRRKDKLKNVARIKQFTQNLLNSGKLNIQQTVDELNEVSKSLISLEYKLKRIAATLVNEEEDAKRAGCNELSYPETITNLLRAVNGGLDEIGNIRSCLVKKVAATRTSMETEVVYVEELNGKAIELNGRSNLIPVDLFDLIFDDLDNFASNLNEYVTRHGGDVVVEKSTVRSMSRMAEPTMEMEFLEMTNNVNAYVDRLEHVPQL